MEDCSGRNVEKISLPSSQNVVGRPTPPGAVRITKIYLDIGRQRKTLVAGLFLARSNVKDWWGSSDTLRACLIRALINVSVPQKLNKIAF